MKLKLLALLPLLALPLLAPAGDLSPTAQAKPAASTHVKKAKAKKAKVVASAKAVKHEHWVCPMHDGGESDHPGKCKKCGMDLVKEEI